jgi:peptide/nickel transport system permease protein
MTESIVPGPDTPGAALPNPMMDGEMLAPVGASGDASGTAAAGLELKARSQWSYARTRFFRHRLAVISLVGLVIIFAAGFLAPVIAPYGYADFDLLLVYHAPMHGHWFGTDYLGHDVFSQTLYGIRTSLEVGVFVAALSTFIGLVLGAIAGYFGGIVDNLLMRLTDLFLTLPFLAILLTASALLKGTTPMRVSLILAALFWTGIARVVRGIFLSLREKEYVEAAKASGAGDARIIFRHILPNTLGPVVVNGTLAVGTAILVEAAISFLGFGIVPPLPSLGTLVQSGQAYPPAWWLVVFPGLVIVFIVLCVNFVGDGLRDALDPQQRIRA